MPKINKRQKLLIDKSFGKNPLEGWAYYNAQKRMDKVKRLHDALSEVENSSCQVDENSSCQVDENSSCQVDENSSWQVDEVTWNDLEMDEVFLRINHTNSFLGEQMLYHKLHILDKGNDEALVSDFENRIKKYEDNPQLRTEIEGMLQYIGKLDEGYYLSEFLLNTKLWKLGNSYVYHGLQILFVLSFILGVFFENMIFVAVLGITAITNLLIYLRAKQKYEIFFNSLIGFKKVYEFVKWLAKKDSKGEFVSQEVKDSLKTMKNMSFVISGMNGRRQASMAGDALAMLREYMWGILLIDVSMFNHTMNIIADKQREVLNLLDFVGEVDTDISVLSYRKSLQILCKPLFIQNGIKAEAAAHPLLNDPVTNDFDLEDKAIITGSNASGKSTFMKSIAINCILGQTINTCVAKEFVMQPLIVVTCMALRDDILSGESYYYREAKCLKRMLDLIDKEENVLVVVDEILKGTNTAERIAASKAILEYIGRRKCITLVATHDNELTETDKYKNYHFRNEIIGDDIVFDYLIHGGKSTQSNAIALLAHLGYPEEVVNEARNNMN